jgi:hypothetical protein
MRNIKKVLAYDTIHIHIFIFCYYVDYILTCGRGYGRQCGHVCSRRLVIPAAPRQPTLVVASRNEVEFGARGKS